MAVNYVSPAHQATLDEFNRIEAKAVQGRPVLEILDVGSTKFKDVKKAYIKLAKRIHPHRGGNFNVPRAESAMVIVARAFEQAKRSAEYVSFCNAGNTWTSSFAFDPDFDLSPILFFSREESEEETELLQAQQVVDEAVESERAAAETAAAAGAAAESGAADAAAGGGGSDDDDDDDDDDAQHQDQDQDQDHDQGSAGLAALFVAAPFAPAPDVAEERFPDFAGVDHSPEHKAYIVESKVFYRKQQQRRAKAKAKVVAKNRLEAAKFASLSWLPLPLADLPVLVAGLVFAQRHEAEQFCRSWAAGMGVQGGVKINAGLESLSVSCHTCNSFCMVSDYQPSTGQWVLRKVAGHEVSCFGAPSPADGATPSEAAVACKSAYTAKQVARLALNSPHVDLDMNLASIRAATLDVFLRPPSTRFIASVKKAARTSMAVDREVDMAALPLYADALRVCGHKVDVYTINCGQMRETRIKAARHIHTQKIKGGTLPADDVFSAGDVDLTNIVDGENYYSGFTFVSSVAETYARQGLKTAYGDASHMEGKGLDSYGTFFDVGTYDQNRSLCSVVSGHGIGPECKDEWKPRFEAAVAVPGFDVAGRVTIVDMEKSIDSAYDDACQHSNKFNDKRHVLKNMSKKLGPAEKTTGPHLYSRALRAPSTLQVDLIKSKYGPAQKAYLGKYPDSELYRAYSPGLKDTIVTSQGAESSMNAALKNKIRRVQPMAMLVLTAQTQQRKFNSKKTAALAWDGPVPPLVEQTLAKLIVRALKYTSITAVPGIAGTYDVGSLADSTVKRRVVMSLFPNTPPECCPWSLVNGIPCDHGAACIVRNNGAANMHKFVEPRYLTEPWQAMYAEATFDIPAQHVFDGIMLEAKQRVLSGDYLHAPKALPPPRGRPVTSAGERNQSWYEQGTRNPKKRAYLCSLCHLKGHTRAKCDLRQMFDEAAGEPEAP